VSGSIAEKPAESPAQRNDAGEDLRGAASVDRPRPPTAEAILATFADCIIVFDNDWRLVYSNAAAEKAWGLEASSMIGKTLHESLQLAPDNPFMNAYAKSKESGEPVAFVGFSEVFGAWVDARGYPHPDGYTILFSAGSRERPMIGRMAETEREREAKRSINQRIFDTSIDLILVVDRRGDFLRVSPSSLAILGYTPEEMTGRSAQNFVHPDDLESTRENMRLARRGRLKRNFECRYLGKSGKPVPIAWTGIWSEPDGQYFFIGRDMTERIALESRLRQAQKMEAVGQLTGGVAHDFNNILTVIIGMTELLSDALARDSKLAPIVAAIDEAGSRGAQLTQRMLAFARKQPLQARNLDLNEIVSRTVTILQRTLGEDITLKTVLTEGLWDAFADPSQVEDALLNLAVNARDAMPNGGQLVIETANAVLDANYAAQNVEVTPGEYAAISLTDSGTGIAPEVLERVFEPFFTTKEVGHGTGLGLSMVYGFVKQSRGHVKIYSEIGHGTRITVYLPRGAAQTAPAATTGPAPGDLVGNETILVVEDSGPVRQVALNMLRTLGYRVLEAEDGPSALAILEQPGKIDLLFTDLIMPNGINGQELLTRARALRPGLRALFTSGYSEQFLKGRGPTDEGVALLNKPYRSHQLADAVRKALDVASPSATGA
jgi:PAS domain S-box-containing protein